jgi:hypothetical protein
MVWHHDVFCKLNLKMMLNLQTNFLDVVSHFWGVLVQDQI